MACSNCFNGCADIISDQCVKYTGIDIPGLEITAGDPLLVVENQIINKILTLMTGEGIIPIIDTADLCPLVSSFLPVAGDITLNHVISALFQTVCALDTRLTAAEGTLNTLNADYVIDCLAGVTPDAGTHDILQAAIVKLCEVSEDLEDLAAEVGANYVLIADINDYIAAYIEDQPVATLMNAKMVPYSAVPFFAPPEYLVGKFDSTGAGLGEWEKIYLCNGQNFTPDLRGRTLVGNSTMGTNPYGANGAADPATSGNPNYAQGDLVGSNLIILTEAQMPIHTHTGDTDAAGTHTHNLSEIRKYTNVQGINGFYDRSQTYDNAGLKTDPAGNHSHAFITRPAGSGGGHPNIQPVYATNFIIYLP
jgi:microcystin-dependent protein